MPLKIVSNMNKDLIKYKYKGDNLGIGRLVQAVVASVITACLASSCTMNASFTPTEGPLAESGITSIPAEFTYNGFGNGKVKVVMPDGEVCEGKYFTVAEGTTSFGTGVVVGAFGATTVNGSSSSYKNKQSGRGLLTGDKGRVLEFEYTTSTNSPTHGYGGGKDNKGNLYKFVF